jgi:adenylate cyclase
MPRPSRRTRRGAFLIASVIIALTIALYFIAPQILTMAELGLYNQHFRLRGARGGDDRIVIVAIDEQSLREVGRWPWSRAVMADLVTRLDQAEAAVIAFDVILNEPERSGELEATARIAERLRARRLDGVVQRELEMAMANADPDRRLADAVRASGRAVLASYFTLGPLPAATAPERQGAPVKSALVAFKHFGERGLYPPPSAEAAGFPIPVLLDAAQSLGHVNMLPDLDGALRWEPLVIEHRGHYYPSLALESVRLAAGIDSVALRLDFGRALELGDVAIPLDPRARVLLDYAGPTKTFLHIPAVDVLRGRVDPERLKDRMIFIGATAEGTYDLRVTPFTPVFPGVEKHATMAANLLDGRFIVRPAWVELIETAGILLLPLLLAWLLPRRRPIPSLAVSAGVWLILLGAAHAAFRQGLWLPVVYPSLAVALTFTGVTVYRFFTEERQRIWTKRAFQQYVSPEVVERIVEDPSALRFGGEIRALTVLFSDIRDFTTFTERHDPQEVVQMLREYLTRMTDCVLRERGTLDKYIGDAVMAIFGAPMTLPDHAERACRAALAMHAEMEQLRAEWTATGKEPFRTGIGINTDEMVVGNLGSEQLFDYTVVGDGVNVGARLESLNKEYQTAKSIIISESTYEAARDAIEVRQLGTVTVKGRTRPVVVYELIGLRTAPARETSAATASAGHDAASTAGVSASQDDRIRAAARPASSSGVTAASSPGRYLGWWTKAGSGRRAADP